MSEHQQHTTSGQSAKRADDALWDVFREQEDSAELLVYRGCLIISLVGLVLPAMASLLRGDTLRDAPFFFIAAFCSLWFGCAVLLRRQGIAVGAVRAITVVIYALVPWVVMAAYVSILGILRAIGVWEPVVFFTAMCVLSIIWARPIIPLVLGSVGAASFLTLWLVTTPPSTWEALPPTSPLQPHIAIYRALFILFIGSVCFWGSRRFRRAVLQGAKALRARDLFGKYRLAEPLGHGGMGSVVKATYCPEGGFERPVAIKRVLDSIASKPDVVRQFRAEAELGSRLVHPNIVAVLDFGRVEQTYFFAMEFVDGPTLMEVLARARRAQVHLPTAFVARVAIEICRGLQHAHEDAVDGAGRPLRVVHRDLCPANILLSRAGGVKLTDFGIARVLGDAEADLTATVVGKVAYMAPELLSRQAFDARADIFSLGVVLWEMLTGERMYERSRTGAVALAVAEEAVTPPSEEREGLSPAWDRVCALCLARDPGQRFSSAAELADELHEILREEEADDSNEVQRVLGELEESAGKAWRGLGSPGTGSSELETAATHRVDVTERSFDASSARTGEAYGHDEGVAIVDASSDDR